MLQSMGSQGVGHDLMFEQQQQGSQLTVLTVSDAQQMDSATHILYMYPMYIIFHVPFSPIPLPSCCRITLSRIPHAIQKVLAGYPF